MNFIQEYGSILLSTASTILCQWLPLITFNNLFLHCICTRYVLVLYAYALSLPADGDLSLIYVGKSVCVDDFV
jgi:hypothetical protein